MKMKAQDSFPGVLKITLLALSMLGWRVVLQYSVAVFLFSTMLEVQSLCLGSTINLEERYLCPQGWWGVEDTTALYSDQIF